MFLNICVVVRESNRKIYGWEITAVEDPTVMVEDFFHNHLHGCLPSSANDSYTVNAGKCRQGMLNSR